MNHNFAIFDMDGTLVDSMGYWVSLSREFLEKQGVQGDLEPILQRIKPLTMLESAALFIEELGVQGTPESIRGEMAQIMEQHYREDIALKPGVLDYLDALRDKGVKMGLASATPPHMIRICLDRLGIADRFAFLLSCDEIGTGKRNPAVFLEAAKRLGAKPEEIAVYEDAIYAVETAHKAGFYTVGIQDINSIGQWEEICQIADATITDWAQAAKAL